MHHWRWTLLSLSEAQWRRVARPSAASEAALVRAAATMGATMAPTTTSRVTAPALLLDDAARRPLSASTITATLATTMCIATAVAATDLAATTALAAGPLPGSA
eukprot:scaffold1753_cov90-Phaeocystis_antarctica.AAC.1